MANSQFKFEGFNEYNTYLASLGEDNGETHSLLLRNLNLALRDELTPKQRRAIKMYYIDRMKMVDIAAKLNLNASTVSRTIKRGRSRLQKCLKYGARELINSYISEIAEKGAERR